MTYFVSEILFVIYLLVYNGLLQPRTTNLTWAYVKVDVFRKLFETAMPTSAAIRGYKSYQRSDFDGEDLPVWWDRIVNKDRYGRCFVFRLLMRHILSWSPVNYTVDEHGPLHELPSTPVEKILVRCTTDAVRI